MGQITVIHVTLGALRRLLPCELYRGEENIHADQTL